MSKRVPRRFAIVAAAAGLFGIVIATPPMAPTANADTLPNGYSVTCTPNGTEAICNISGCPRVHADEAGDVVHIEYNGFTNNLNQQELSKGCNSAATATFYETTPAGFTLSIQGCRKNKASADDCGAWSDYKYTPPAPAAANAPPAPPNAPPPVAPPVNCPAGSVSGTVPAGQHCQAGAPVNCPAGSVSATVPAGQQCQALPPPTNAVTFNFQKNGLQINAIVVNKSTVAGKCHYDAVNTNGIIPERTDDFPIGANATVTRTFPAPPPLAKFHATVTCTGDFNGKSDQFGNTSADVTG
jgi:hypothetical protein